MSTTTDARAARRAQEPDREVSGWTVGFVGLAGVLLAMLGGFHIIAGIAGIVSDGYFVVGSSFASALDPTAWGWVNLLGGAVILAAGIGVFGGRVWARAIGVALAVVSAVDSFLFIPYQPFWSIAMLVIAAGVIWALLAYGRREARGF